MRSLIHRWIEHHLQAASSVAEENDDEQARSIIDRALRDISGRASAASCPMDRRMQLSRLRMAERHVIEGDQRVNRQERLVAELDRHGHSTTEARKLLGNFYDVQRLHLEHRSRMLRELQE